VSAVGLGAGDPIIAPPRMSLAIMGHVQLIAMALPVPSMVPGLWAAESAGIIPVMHMPGPIIIPGLCCSVACCPCGC
jgi:hypothetical protein